MEQCGNTEKGREGIAIISLFYLMLMFKGGKQKYTSSGKGQREKSKSCIMYRCLKHIKYFFTSCIKT